MPLEWTPALSVGNDEIDTQHRERWTDAELGRFLAKRSA